MEATTSAYSHIDSSDRIKELLDSSDNDYSDKDSIPARADLTYTNGFYVNCSSLFVDMRGSKGLSEKHTRPVLAKIYRAYISELISVMRSNTNVSEISIEGDCVWGAFDTPYKPNIDVLFSTAARVSSLIDILNWRLRKKQYSEITVGVGLSFGTALMIKAGSKNSGINDIVYMGKVVSDAARLCSLGNRTYGAGEIYVSSDFYSNLNEGNQKLLTKDWNTGDYYGNVVNVEMNDWLKQQILNE